MDGYRYHNSEPNLGITHQELGTPKVITTSRKDVIEEYFSHHQNLDSHIEGRLVYK
jgi:5'-nucleotidase